MLLVKLKKAEVEKALSEMKSDEVAFYTHIDLKNSITAGAMMIIGKDTSDAPAMINGGIVQCEVNVLFSSDDKQESQSDNKTH